jgi:hypothetical protein
MITPLQQENAHMIASWAMICYSASLVSRISGAYR